MKKYVAQYVPINAEIRSGDRFKAPDGTYPIFMRLSNANDGEYAVEHALIRADKETPAEFINVRRLKIQPYHLYLVAFDLVVGQRFLTVLDNELCGGLITEDRGSTWRVGTAFDNVEINKREAFNIIARLNDSTMDWVSNGHEFYENTVKIANKEEGEEYPKVRVKCGMCKTFH